MMNCQFLLMIVLACGVMPGLAYATDGFYDSNGVKIRYVTAGEGEPVVLIHGWMGDSSMWGRDKSGNAKLDTSRASGFQLIALDCRGHGKSDKPHDPEKYGAEMAVDDGKGLGAYVIAVTPPDKPKPTMEQANAIANYLFDGKDVKALAAAGRSFKNLEVTSEELGKCKAPTLFIYGANESDQLKERVATLRKVLGRGEVKLIEGGDHMTTLTKPEFGSSIIEFLRSHKAKDVGH